MVDASSHVVLRRTSGGGDGQNVCTSSAAGRIILATRWFSPQLRGVGAAAVAGEWGTTADSSPKHAQREQVHGHCWRQPAEGCRVGCVCRRNAHPHQWSAATNTPDAGEYEHCAGHDCHPHVGETARSRVSAHRAIGIGGPIGLIRHLRGCHRNGRHLRLRLSSFLTERVHRDQTEDQQQCKPDDHHAAGRPRTHAGPVHGPAHSPLAVPFCRLDVLQHYNSRNPRQSPRASAPSSAVAHSCDDRAHSSRSQLGTIRAPTVRLTRRQRPLFERPPGARGHAERASDVSCS